jgi:hypothetical protein
MTRYSTEEKKTRFKRLAAARTDAVLDKLRILSNCANPQLYEYSERELKMIFDAVEDQLNIVKTRFRRKRREKFSWD